MAIENPELQFVMGLDRWATIRQRYIAAAEGGVNFWDLADASDDEVYENWCSGWSIWETDNMLASAALGDAEAVQKWLNAHQAWITTPATAARPGLGYASWNAYLLAKVWRVPWHAGELYFDRYKSRLGAVSVFAKGILSAAIGDNSVARLHDYGQFVKGSPDVWTPNEDDLDTTKTVGAPTLINIEVDSTNITASITAKRASGGTKEYASISVSGTEDEQIILGEKALTGETAAGQKVIACTGAATADYAANDYALLYESDALQEIMQIASVQNGASYTCVANLRHSYTTDAKVWPLHTGIAAVTASGGASGKGFSLYARPDRTIGLGA